MDKKIAFITGVTGQDGSYLAEFLLSKDYVVHGMKPLNTLSDTYNIDSIVKAYSQTGQFHVHAGDMSDGARLHALISRIRPHEVYNLAAQSHVHTSFESPVATFKTNALGQLDLLEAIRNNDLAETCRFYQASSSEIFGNPAESPQQETTPFQPRSPYGIAKLAAYWVTVNYRQAYNMHANNGILFNHESPRRGHDFVTRKVSRAVASITLGLQDKLYLGNLNAQRDWGHARDYVQAMWLMLQQPRPDDYTIATGEMRTVRQLVEIAFAYVGKTLHWAGEGEHEKGLDSRTKRVLVEVDATLFRPTEVQHLRGDATKARFKLGWKPRTGFAQMIHEMVAHDLAELDQYQTAPSTMLKVAEDSAATYP